MTAVVRAATTVEAGAVASLLNAHSTALHGEADVTESIVFEWFENPDLQIRVAEVDGGLACYGDLMLSVDGTRADLDIREHPTHPGSAQLVLEALERVAGERGARCVRAYVDTGERSTLAALAARGYRPIRHSFRMGVSLADDTAEPRWPEGFAVRAMAPGAERDVHAAHQDAFHDHWGFEHQPYDRWARWFLETERFDRSLNFIAFHRDEVAGLCLCSKHWSGDPSYGWVGVLGVRPAWRRRGLGLALLLHAFAEFRRRGCDRVGLGVDARARRERSSSTNAPACTSSGSTTRSRSLLSEGTS